MPSWTVGELMSTQVVTVAPEASLSQIADLMFERQVRHLPVVDAGQVVGVISHTDLVKAGFADADEVSAGPRAAVHVMSVAPDTVSPQDSAAEAGAVLLREKYGCLPVVSDGELVGILTDSDFVRHLIQLSDT